MSAAHRTAAELAALRNANIARGVLTAHPITVARAEGALVWDVEGKQYLAFEIALRQGRVQLRCADRPTHVNVSESC